MPRYDESPSGHRSGGHSPLDRRSDRRPVLSDRRRRESPLTSSSMRTMNSREYDDYRNHSSHHRNDSNSSSSMPYKILCVSNISNKFGDNSVREALTREFHRFGEPNVKLVYDDNTRLAYLYFRNYDDARDARHAKSRLILFDKTIIIDPIYERNIQMPRRRSISPDYQNRSIRPPPSPPPIPRGRPPPPPMRNSMNDMKYMQTHRGDNYRENMHNMRNDYHHSASGGGAGGGGGGGGGVNRQQQHRESKKEKFPNYLHHIPPEEDDKATRTLFVGNLEVTITDADLRRIFERYGVVEDIDVKRPPPGQGNAYAFIKFLNLDMAHRSKVEMSGQYIGKFQCKIGYGKATPTTRIWVGGLGPWSSLSHLSKEFDRFGVIRKIDFVKGDNHSYISFDSIDAAQSACQEMRGFPLGGHDKRLRIDYADATPYSGTPPFPNAGAGDQFVGSGGRRDETNEEWNPNLKFGGSSGDFNDSFERNASQNRGRDFNEDVKREREFPSGAGSNSGNYEPQWWGEGREGQQFSPNSDRRVRRRTPPDVEPDRKRQRRNSGSPTAGDDRSITSPRRSRGADSIGRSSPNYETNGKDEMKVTVNENVSTIAELAKCCPIAWNGGLILKNSSFPSRMLFCSGDLQLVDQYMKDSSDQPSLKITQRLRLVKGKLNDVTQRMNIAGNSGYCLLLTTSGAIAANQTTNLLSEDGSAIQLRPLKNLVTYLKQKDAAGVISTKDGKDMDVHIYLFPPCAYAIELLHRVAPNLSGDSITKEDYLVVVVVRSSN